MSIGNSAELQGGQELSYVTQKDAYAGTLFSRVIQAINSLAKNSGTAAVGKIPSPPPIDSINVSGPAPVNGIITLPSDCLLYTSRCV